jgi:hypothetical protein
VRLSVEGAALGDPRFRKLGKTLKMPWQEATGRCLLVWLVCYERREPLLLLEDLDIIADFDGFGAGMVSAGLAEQVGDRARVRGVTDRIEFLVRHAAEQARKGRRSGEVRRERAAGTNLGSSGGRHHEHRGRSRHRRGARGLGTGGG